MSKGTVNSLALSFPTEVGDSPILRPVPVFLWPCVSYPNSGWGVWIPLDAASEPKSEGLEHRNPSLLTETLWPLLLSLIPLSDSL